MTGSAYSGCFVCGQDNPLGLHLDARSENGQAQAKLTVRESFAGYPGIVHGGVTTALLDEIMVKAIEGLGSAVVTASLEVKFRQTVPTGVELLLQARVLKQGERIFRAAGELYLPDGTLAAEASGTFVKAPGQIMVEAAGSTQVGK